MVCPLLHILPYVRDFISPLIYDLVEEVTSHGIVVLQCVHQCLPAMLMQGSYGGLDQSINPLIPFMACVTMA